QPRPARGTRGLGDRRRDEPARRTSRGRPGDLVPHRRDAGRLEEPEAVAGLQERPGLRVVDGRRPEPGLLATVHVHEHECLAVGRDRRLAPSLMSVCRLPLVRSTRSIVSTASRYTPGCAASSFAARRCTYIDSPDAAMVGLA